MSQNKTVVFTISEESSGYWIHSDTHLGFGLNCQGTEYFRGVSESLLFDTLAYISSELNARGYKVVFNVD